MEQGIIILRQNKDDEQTDMILDYLGQQYTLK